MDEYQNNYSESKKPDNKRLHPLWFHLYKILWMPSNLQWQSRSVVAWRKEGWEKLWRDTNKLEFNCSLTWLFTNLMISLVFIIVRTYQIVLKYMQFRLCQLYLNKTAKKRLSDGKIFVRCPSDWNWKTIKKFLGDNKNANRS